MKNIMSIAGKSLFALACFLTFGCDVGPIVDMDSGHQISYLTDSRDGKVYKTVKIGRHTWMAENLNFEVYEGTQSKCLEDEPENCLKYGRLYSWAAAVGKSEDRCGSGHKCNLSNAYIQGICPDGWHLPSMNEFRKLVESLGGEDDAGKLLKSSYGWDEYEGMNGNGVDTLGFSLLSAGNYMFSGNERFNGKASFNGKGKEAYLFSSTENDDSVISYMYFVNDSKMAYYGTGSKKMGLSIRCVKNFE